MSTITEILAGGRGCKVLKDGQSYDVSKHPGKAVRIIQVTAATVFSAIEETVSGAANTSVIGENFLNVNSDEQPAGTLLSPYEEGFTKVSVTTGRVVLYFQ